MRSYAWKLTAASLRATFGCAFARQSSLPGLLDAADLHGNRRGYLFLCTPRDVLCLPAKTVSPDLVALTRLGVHLSSDRRSYVQSTSTLGESGERHRTHKIQWQREYEHLGGGTFGQVYLEKCMEAGRAEEKHAVKKIRKIGSIDYKRELEVLAALSYRKRYRDYFVNFIGWYETNDHVYIAMDFHELGSLDKYVAPAHAPLPEPEVKTILEQMLKGLGYMHELQFMHRDLKPANFLVVTTGPQWWVKLADFGFSKRATNSHAMEHTDGGTRPYMAPEMQGIIQNGTYKRSDKVSYTEAVDIWAVGIMAFQILAGRLPFRPGEIEGYAIGKIRFPVKPLRKVAASDEACEFVRSLMTPLPTRRPDAKECLQQYWLQTHTQVPEQTTCSSHSSLEGGRSIHELEEASATWESDEASRVEAEKQDPVSDEVAASDIASLSSVASGTVPPVQLSGPAVHIDPSTIIEAGPFAPERAELPEFSCLTLSDVTTTGNDHVPICNESVPASIASQHLPQSLNDADAPSGPPENLTAEEPPGTRIQDSESNEPHDHKEPNVYVHDERLLVLPEIMQESARPNPANPPVETDLSKRSYSRSANAILENTEPAAEQAAKDNFAPATCGLQDTNSDPTSAKGVGDSQSDTKPDLPTIRRRELSSEASLSAGKKYVRPYDHIAPLGHRTRRNGDWKKSSRQAPPIYTSSRGALQNLSNIKRNEDHPTPSARKGSAKPRSADYDAEGPSHIGSSPGRHPHASQIFSTDSSDSRPSSRRRTDSFTRSDARRERKKAYIDPASSPEPDGHRPRNDKNSGDDLDNYAINGRRSGAYEQNTVRRPKTAQSHSRRKEGVRATSACHAKTTHLPSPKRKGNDIIFSRRLPYPMEVHMPVEVFNSMDDARFRREIRKQVYNGWSSKEIDDLLVVARELAVARELVGVNWAEIEHF